MAGVAVDVCLRVLKESNKSRFESYSVRNSELIVSRITFWDCRVHIFSDNLPRNGCLSHGRSWAQFPSRTQNIFWDFLSTYIILFARIWILNLFSHKFNNSNNNNNYKARTKAWTNARNGVCPAILMTHRKILFFFCDREHALLP